MSKVDTVRKRLKDESPLQPLAPASRSFNPLKYSRMKANIVLCRCTVLSCRETYHCTDLRLVGLHISCCYSRFIRYFV